MAHKIKKSEITYLAKRICKINEQLLNICLSAEELVQDETLRNIFFEKDEAVLRELQEKVLKYSDLEEPAVLPSTTAPLSSSFSIENIWLFAALREVVFVE